MKKTWSASVSIGEISAIARHSTPPSHASSRPTSAPRVLPLARTWRQRRT